MPTLTANLKMPTMKNKSLIRQLPPFDEWKLIPETTPDKGLKRLRKFQDFLSYFSSFGKYNLSCPQKLGPSKVSTGCQVFGSIILPPQPFSTKKPEGVIE